MSPWLWYISLLEEGFHIEEQSHFAIFSFNLGQQGHSSSASATHAVRATYGRSCPIRYRLWRLSVWLKEKICLLTIVNRYTIKDLLLDPPLLSELSELNVPSIVLHFDLKCPHVETIRPFTSQGFEPSISPKCCPAAFLLYSLSQMISYLAFRTTQTTYSFTPASLLVSSSTFITRTQKPNTGKRHRNGFGSMRFS